MSPGRALKSFRIAAAASFLATVGGSAATAQETPSPAARLAAIEARTGGRLGVAALDTGSGRRIEYRAAGRFAMCSTFKLLLAGAVLARVDAQQESLERHVAYGPSDLLEYAPVTNDLAIAWPPDRPPVLAAVYFTGSTAPLGEREAALAEVGRLIATDPSAWSEPR